MQNIATRIISKFGGVTKVAKLVKINASSVHRWTYPKKRGGTGGIIPTRHQDKLLAKARENGVELSPADFFA